VRLYGERVVRSVANLTRHDAEEFLPLAAAIPVHSEVEIFALEQANAVLKRLKQGGIRGSAVLQVVDRAV
jgi:propanol-preferring alcohol dehydrogenase